MNLSTREVIMTCQEANAAFLFEKGRILLPRLFFGRFVRTRVGGGKIRERAFEPPDVGPILTAPPSCRPSVP